ncbi:uncharacterized protein BO72DRAFT_421189 [Aspergillus fijiensis CBS 313.89]|uniref:Hexosyltransferase n=1 Tax=Aspergillus fijiensis CBS 313.89 TaxID=1448319 RepID=A0A8G1W244_9EURO|nr:uncharacterized protein BO72DRAFT_421189 [Aspergillus fijiensis CBS 313.89]RAK81615.1 hypothetical protein BO72DRAFT_421189 [Aspergillus fijiensis CBS 313.89]
MIPASDPKFDPEPWSACLPPRPKSRQTGFIGVWSSAKDFNRRALIRLTYLRNKPHDLDVYFVLGRPETDQEQTLVALEMAAYHDILLLNMTENLTEGKTFEFFRTVGVTFKPGDYAFVTKMDSDVWCELPQFTTQLQRLLYQKKSMGTYFGRAIGGYFMAGMGYTLSWDLVRWIATDAYPDSHRDGFEDQLVADWLHHSGLLVHFVSEEAGIYDTPDYAGHGDGGWAQNYTDPTLIVHQLKSDEWFLRTAKYFLGGVG